MRGGPARVYLSLSHLGGCARNLVRYVAFFSPLAFPLFGRGEVRESVASFAADSYSSFLSVFLNVTENVSYRVSRFSSVSHSLFSKKKYMEKEAS